MSPPPPESARARQTVAPDAASPTRKHRLSALIVSYSFPPVGGAGVARVLKLAKYLPDHGVTPSILTVSNPSVPVVDPSRDRDVRPDLEILRAPTLEPGYAVKKAAWSASASTRPDARGDAQRLLGRTARGLLIPDPQVLWQPGAAAALGRKLLGPGRPDAVFVSGPPFSQFLLGPLARLRPGTAVVLDYRDEWSTYRTQYEMMSPAAAAAGAIIERVVLRSAHAVTTATEAFRRSLLERFPFLDPDRVVAIPNGYDPDDIPTELPEPPRDRFVVTYAGTVFKLTSPAGLLGAIRRLHATEPELARHLEVRFLGRIVDTEMSAFEGMESLGVRQLGYMDHERVVDELAASHLLLCLLDEVPGAERIYPAKVFELMALPRPCLTLAPTGALAQLVHRHRVGDLLSPRDEADIADYLARRLRDFVAGRPPAYRAPVDIERYHRRALAGDFADVFETAVRRARD